MSDNNLPFWKTKSLSEMSKAEWELLCDGCAQCCLSKLEDEDTGERYITNVACHMLDINTCRCRDYSHRLHKVSTCLALSPANPELFEWLPQTCAYRRLAEGRDLPKWHPLVSHDHQLVHTLGISVQKYAISEEYIHPEQLELHIIEKLD